MTNYYIREFPKGDDNNDGLSPVSSSYGVGPWATIGKANITLQDGDTVYIGAGEYTSVESPPTQLGQHIWIESGSANWSADMVVHYIGDPTGVHTSDSGSVRISFALIKDAEVHITDIDLYEYYLTPPPTSVYYGSLYVHAEILSPNHTLAVLNKCKVAERSYILHANVDFVNCFLGYKAESKDTIIIINNFGADERVRLLMEYCTIFNATSSNFNVSVQATDEIEIYSVNNIFVNFNPFPVTSLHGIYYFVSTPAGQITYAGGRNHYEYYDGNFIYDQGTQIRRLSEWEYDGDSSEGWSYVIGFIQQPDGYRLNSESPCIDSAGTIVGIDEDIEGNVRPNGSAPDKGCYEWQDLPDSYSRTYYIRKPPNGNDGNSGLSKGAAWATIGKALSTIQNYDVVYIGAGTYAEDLVVPVSGSYVKFIGDLLGTYTNDSGSILIQSFYNSGCHHSWVENVHFYDEYIFSPVIRGGMVVRFTHGGEFRQLIVDKAIYMEGVYCTRLVNIVSHPNPYMGDPGYARYAIRAWNGSLSNWFYHNTFIHDSGSAQLVGACAYIGGPYNAVINNIFKKTGTLEWMFWKADHNYLSDDVFAYNFYQYSGSTKFYHDNTTTYNTFEAWQISGLQDVDGSAVGDPLFKEDGYHLTKDSPCIDVGIDEYGDFIINVFLDIDLHKRPIMLGFDIGADEFVPFSSEDFFDFMPPSRVRPIEIRRTPYREPQLKWTCTHYLSGVQYILSTCPRCLGKGYFYDVRFDAGGLIPQVWDETKLMQELEKITLTDFNPFHPEYGAKLKRRIGQVSRDELRAIVKRDLLAAVYNLIKYQKAEASKGTQNGYFSSRELIDRVEKVEITELSTTELAFAIYIITIHGKEVELTGKILV